MNERRHSQPYLTKVQNQAALKRRQSIHGSIVHPKNDSKINASSLMSRRNKRYSVANAIMVTGVTEALLLGLLSKDKKDKDDDLCSLISSASELFTSLDVSDSVTDLTSDDSIKNKTLREKHNVSEESTSASDESNLTVSISRDDQIKHDEEQCHRSDSEIWKKDRKEIVNQTKLVTQV